MWCWGGKWCWSGFGGGVVVGGTGALRLEERQFNRRWANPRGALGPGACLSCCLVLLVLVGGALLLPGGAG